MPGDRPEDPEFGPFWKRHRELDNMLSSAFMFLPERFRLPANIRDPVAVQANLNLHAAVINLHNTAREKADKFKLAGIRQSSRTRALTAAREIVDIMKTTGQMKAGYRGPLVALSLYLAASVFISQAKEEPGDFDRTNLDLLIKCMAAVGRQHIVTQAYLRQLLLDLERHGLSAAVDSIQSFQFVKNMGGHGIPLVARGATSRHTKMLTPLPGRLPLGSPQGVAYPSSTVPPIPCSNFVGPILDSVADEVEGPASKRMRTSAGTSTGNPIAKGRSSTLLPSLWFAKNDEEATARDARASSASMFEAAGASSWSYSTTFSTANLPDRTGSPAMNNQAGPSTAAPAIPNLADFSGLGPTGVDSAFTQMPSVGPSSASNAGFIPNPTATAANTNLAPELGDLGVFENLGEWGLTDPESLYSMLVDMSGDDFGGGASKDSSSVDPWTRLNNAGGGESSSASRPWDTGGGGSGS
ncbi:hypothetical protein VTI74DRAFT_10635 [Chaetomium olivicolor]